jgi:hypothetical protein
MDRDEGSARAARYRRLVLFSKMMCPIRRAVLPGASADDAAVEQYLASTSMMKRREIARYIESGVGQCYWPEVEEPTQRSADERAALDTRINAWVSQLLKQSSQLLKQRGEV